MFIRCVLFLLFRFAPENLGLNMGWGDDMSNSVEFKPLTKLNRYVLTFVCKTKFICLLVFLENIA